MGEGFRNKTRKAYKHFIQNQASSLAGGQLLAKPEVQNVRYPCEIEEGVHDIRIGLQLTLVARTALSRIDLVRGNEIVGLVKGEAVVSLRRLFKVENVWPAILAVTVATVRTEQRLCEVSPA